MNEKYLVINAGSSSVKFKLFDMPSKEIVSSGTIERIGKEGCCWKIKYNGNEFKDKGILSNHVDAVKVILKTLLEKGVIADLGEIKGIGHRVLHGAEDYSESVLINDEVLTNLNKLIQFGPLHMPGAIAVIDCMREVLPQIPQIAAFDTAFHQTIPEKNYRFPIDNIWYEEKGVRSYGFHGLSYKYITDYVKKDSGIDDVNLIICHIDSGASVAVIKDGKCIDTSMGLTPLDGLMMGTRCGSIDPSCIEFMARSSGKSVAEINAELNEKSGLLGIAGKNDWRDVEDAALKGDKKAQLAIEMFVGSVVKFISYYYAQLGGKVHAIVFTAGIGENSSMFRKLVIDEIKDAYGIILDDRENDKIAAFKEKKSGVISYKMSKIPVCVIPTNEEVVILEDTYRIVNELNKGKAKVKNI